MKSCDYCHAELVRKSYGGRPEPMRDFNTRRFCDRGCQTGYNRTAGRHKQAPGNKHRSLKSCVGCPNTATGMHERDGRPQPMCDDCALLNATQRRLGHEGISEAEIHTWSAVNLAVDYSIPHRTSRKAAR